MDVGTSLFVVGTCFKCQEDYSSTAHHLQVKQPTVHKSVELRSTLLMNSILSIVVDKLRSR